MIFARIKLAIGAALAAVIAFLAASVAVLRGRAVRAENEALRQEVKGHDIRNEVENRIAAERDANQRLHDKWRR